MFSRQRQFVKNQELKNRVLKNNEAVLDVIAQNIKGSRQCPLMLGQKCMGVMCELFQEYTTTTPDKKKLTYSVCNFNQFPRLIIESMDVQRQILTELRAIQKLIIAVYENGGQYENESGK